MLRAGGGPARQPSFAMSCAAISVAGSGSRRFWSASSITPRPVMPRPHESHHLPAPVIGDLPDAPRPAGRDAHPIRAEQEGTRMSMNGNRYDAIVVGARCAGSPTAMLLARKDYRVLVVDRATFPSDTLSTHIVHPPGVASLRRWGLLDLVTATGCPPIHTYAFDFGPFTTSGAPGTDETPAAYAPRRTVLDKLLVDAAAEAGAEVREGFTVTEVLTE